MHQQHHIQKKTCNSNDVDENLGKPNHYTIVMGDFNAQKGKRTNHVETAMGKFGLELRNERSDILVEWVTSRKYKIMNTIFQTKTKCNKDRN